MVCHLDPLAEYWHPRVSNLQHCDCGNLSIGGQLLSTPISRRAMSNIVIKAKCLRKNTVYASVNMKLSLARGLEHCRHRVMAREKAAL